MRVPDPGSFQPFSRTPQNHCLQIASVISQYTAPPASQTMKQAIVSTGKQNFRPNINEISTSWTAYCYVQSAARAKCSATPVTTGLRRIWQECCGWNSVHGRCSCEDSVSTRTVRKREREREGGKDIRRVFDVAPPQIDLPPTDGGDGHRSSPYTPLAYPEGDRGSNSHRIFRIFLNCVIAICKIYCPSSAPIVIKS